MFLLTELLFCSEFYSSLAVSDILDLLLFVIENSSYESILKYYIEPENNHKITSKHKLTYLLQYVLIKALIID